MIEVNRQTKCGGRRTVCAGIRIALGVAALVSVLGAPAHAQCVGDCDGDGMVEINELILGVNISLGTTPLSSCPVFDADGSGGVEINELITAVNNALGGCPPTATATATASVTPPPSTATSTATGSATATLLAATATATASATGPPPETPTGTPTGTATATVTEPQATATGTSTYTGTQTPTATGMPTGTATATATVTSATPPATATSTLTSVATTTATPSSAATGTPTATIPVITATFTPTATPTTGATCGNNLLEPGETCQSCAADCVVQPCTPTMTTVAFVFDLVPPAGQSPTDVAVRLGYRSDLVSIPGMGSEASVLSRIVAPPPAPIPFIRNDQNYAVAITLGRPMAITELFTITFDRCQGAPAPTVADFGCSIEGCASGGPPIEGCTCLVRTE